MRMRAQGQRVDPFPPVENITMQMVPGAPWHQGLMGRLELFNDDIQCAAAKA